MDRRTFLHAIGTAAFGALAAACSPAPAPVSTSSRDPSSPSGPEGRDPLAASGSGSPAPPPPPVPTQAPATSAPLESADDAGAAALTYVCPMHPEVTSTVPGVCPKCNMKLVPKK